MRPAAYALAGLLLGTPAWLAFAADARPAATSAIVAAEKLFVDFLDARDAVASIEAGTFSRLRGQELHHWRRAMATRRTLLDARLSDLTTASLAPADAEAVAAMRRSLSEFDTDAGAEEPQPACRDSGRSDLGYAALRTALVACFTEYGNHLRFEGREIDRGSALQLLHVIEQPARRQTLFASFLPLWTAINGRGDAASPYRRLIAAAAADAARRGSQIDAAAKSLGVDAEQVERWLVQVLGAWRTSNADVVVEPWDFRYVNAAANRRLQASIPLEALTRANKLFYRDLGADLDQLGVVFDLAPRGGKSPLAYTDFQSRGREQRGVWRRPRARVVASYPEGGLFSLNELVHESGHAVHVSAIRTRPAYMDWPDTLFTEAFADVPAWSVHEPAWQQRYLGTAADECASQRALFANVMLDVAWSLFEIRMLRDPAADPNLVWTEITARYLRVAPHPEMPWWALRVQLASNPGYMVNYGLGAVLTAEIRDRTAETIGPFDTGNARWYAWSSQRLLASGSQLDTRALMTTLSNRSLSPEALLRQLRRCKLGG